MTPQTVRWPQRRAFLGQVPRGTLCGWIAAGSPLALLTAQPAWALDLKVLSSAEGRTLLAMSRTIAPHDKLEDAAYALAVAALDGGAAQDAGLLGLLRTGCAQLDSGSPAFTERDEAARVAALRAIEPTPFFQAVRVNTMQHLYATPMAAALFGYEGESFTKGGYLYRGFNDLRWLPEVPLAAGGPLPV